VFARTAILLGALGLSAGLAQAQPYEVFPDSSQRRLGDYDVQDLNCQQLWVARNEIYHRNGFCFKTRRGRNFFGNAGCSTSNPRLSRTERRNVELIQSWEADNGCR